MERVIPIVLALAAASVLVAWSTMASAVAPTQEDLEVHDHTNDYSVPPAPPPPAELVKGSGTAADIPGAWPRFRGSDGTNVVDDGIDLIDSWGEGGPPELWHDELGIGHSSFSVYGGKVYIQDYDTDNELDMIRCLSLADGRELWRNQHALAVKPNHGVTRGNPAVNDRYVAAIGPKCLLVCLDAQTGERLWAKDMVGEWGTKVPVWWNAQSVLFDGDTLVVAPCGNRDDADDGAMVVGLDPATGDERWRAINPRHWKFTHASINDCQLDGQKTYVYCGDKGVAGIAADGSGRILWDTALWQVKTATVTVPVDCGENRIFLSGGYGSGSMMIQVVTKTVEIDGTPQEIYQAEELWRMGPTQDGYGSEQHGPVLFEDHLYGVNTKNGEVVCLTLDGEQLWSSGRDHRFGLGPFLVADGKLFALSPKGRLEMAAISPEGYTMLAEAEVTNGINAWAPMAVVNGRLLLRDQEFMQVFDLTK